MARRTSLIRLRASYAPPYHESSLRELEMPAMASVREAACALRVDATNRWMTWPIRRTGVRRENAHDAREGGRVDRRGTWHRSG